MDELKKASIELEKELSKAKFKRKEPDGKGGFNYIYDEPKKKSKKSPAVKPKSAGISAGKAKEIVKDVSSFFHGSVTGATLPDSGIKYDKESGAITFKPKVYDEGEMKDAEAFKGKVKNIHSRSRDSKNTELVFDKSGLGFTIKPKKKSKDVESMRTDELIKEIVDDGSRGFSKKDLSRRNDDELMSLVEELREDSKP